MSSTSAIDTSTQYWDARAARFGRVADGLPAVCSYGMPRLYNWAIHRCQIRALAPWIGGCHDLDVLDVGCGVGRWSLRLAARGNRVVGADLSSTMIDVARQRATERALDAEFVACDAAELRLLRRFDLVLAVTVLQHILDPADFATTVRNLAQHLEPGGMLVLLEVAPTQSVAACDSPIFRARTLADYERALTAAGLRICAVAGVDVVPLRPLLMPAVRRLPRPLQRTLLTAGALAALPVDLALSGLLPDRSWHKVIVARPAPGKRV